MNEKPGSLETEWENIKYFVYNFLFLLQLVYLYMSNNAKHMVKNFIYKNIYKYI